MTLLSTSAQGETFILMLPFISLIIYFICLFGSLSMDKKKITTTSRTFRIIKRVVSLSMLFIGIFLTIACFNSFQNEDYIIGGVVLIIIGSIILFINIKINEQEKKQVLEEIEAQKTLQLANPQVILNKNDKPMTIWQWMYTIVLMSIPVVNIIMGIIWLCGVGNKSRRSYVRAYLILVLIIVGIFLLILAIFSNQVLTFFNNLTQTFAKI